MIHIVKRSRAEGTESVADVRVHPHDFPRLSESADPILLLESGDELTIECDSEFEAFVLRHVHVLDDQRSDTSEFEDLIGEDAIYSYGALADRSVTVNGVTWLPLESGIVIPDLESKATAQRLIASVGFCETASMTSGWDGSKLVLLWDNVLLYLDKADEEPYRVSVHPPSDLVDAVVAWMEHAAAFIDYGAVNLQNIQTCFAHLLLTGKGSWEYWGLAVDDSSDQVSKSYLASPTSEWSLSIGLSPAEVTRLWEMLPHHSLPTHLRSIEPGVLLQVTRVSSDATRQTMRIWDKRFRGKAEKPDDVVSQDTRPNLALRKNHKFARVQAGYAYLYVLGPGLGLALPEFVEMLVADEDLATVEESLLPTFEELTGREWLEESVEIALRPCPIAVNGIPLALTSADDLVLTDASCDYELRPLIWKPLAVRTISNESSRTSEWVSHTFGLVSPSVAVTVREEDDGPYRCSFEKFDGTEATLMQLARAFLASSDFNIPEPKIIVALLTSQWPSRIRLKDYFRDWRNSEAEYALDVWLSDQQKLTLLDLLSTGHSAGQVHSSLDPESPENVLRNK